MQVNYKTISSMEFDVLSGTYKKVDKEVEDTSGALFANLFEAGKEEKTEAKEALQTSSNTASSSSNSLFDNLASNVQTLRFRQNENEVLKAQEELKNADSNLNDLLSLVS
ncbi:hypothetical protein DMB92_06175 [Campylobacter sp. MIT 99-7217]|uniref:hypothetical protein n=1 Tax=Campylobacter sp. MIT 99-7217 TaxID=535091 RepID=UPI001159C007|nr:hypothetical protein [Campylobacter sp. MIT 99-7217]TQR31275.1 hypothetical protein DMB92_06175 [Campylobacter sp. MIT 99-7217]